MKKIYVGNLSYRTTDSGVKSAFEAYGSVSRATIVVDKETGRSKGFGFVEMDDQSAETAIAALNGHELDGRVLTVNEARARESNRSNRDFNSVTKTDFPVNNLYNLEYDDERSDRRRDRRVRRNVRNAKDNRFMDFD